MSIITKLLEKRGLDEKTLNDEEKAQIESWKKILDREEITLDDLKTFISEQIDLIETRWAKYGNQYELADLIPYHTIYKTLLRVIESPKEDKKRLEEYIESLI